MRKKIAVVTSRYTEAEPAVQDALAALREMSTTETRDGMARFGIPSDNALGVSVADIRRLAKELGPDHELARRCGTPGCMKHAC
jgi:3-methyladenine DNA glycosylase AlkD